MTSKSKICSDDIVIYERVDNLEASDAISLVRVDDSVNGKITPDLIAITYFEEFHYSSEALYRKEQILFNDIKDATEWYMKNFLERVEAEAKRRGITVGEYKYWMIDDTF